MKCNIRIDEKKKDNVIERLNAVISEVQKRSKERNIYAMEILKTLSEVNKSLNLSSKQMEGVSIIGNPNGQEFPSAYYRKGYPMATVFTAVFTNGFWKITEIKRDDCGRNKVKINLTEAAKEIIITRYSFL